MKCSPKRRNLNSAKATPSYRICQTVSLWHLPQLMSWGRSVSIVSDYRLDNWATGVRSRADARRFSALTFVSRPALTPTQPPIQWIPGVLSPWVERGQAVTLTTHPHLVPASRMRNCVSSPLCRLHDGSGTSLLYFYPPTTQTVSYIQSDPQSKLQLFT
jgi:hypothetical protein